MTTASASNSMPIDANARAGAAEAVTADADFDTPAALTTAAFGSAPARVFLSPLPASHAALFAELDRWVAQGWLRALDRSFVAFLAQQAPDADPLLILAAAWASHQLGRGHACLDLAAALADAGKALSLPPEGAPAAQATADEALPASPAALLEGVTLAGWLAALQHPALVSGGAGATPLVQVGTRLYLRRYWKYEQSVRQAIGERAARPTAAARPEMQAALTAALAALFPPAAGADASRVTDWQKIACALAARQHFSIVTGGPGTGKTTTVVRLLAMLQSLALSAHGDADGEADGDGNGAGRKLRIRLAAPTGKAAARLNESIAGAVERLPLAGMADAEAVRGAIPTDVTTVHRLLGSRPDTRNFRHNARNPLALDVLVIDEASMLDLEMMAAVLAALPAEARLILLGDKDQLASVEAGAVLGDLCQRADGGHYLPQTAAWVRAVTGEPIGGDLVDAGGMPLDQAVVKLRVSHRFSEGSGIGQLAAAVNAGEGRAVRAVFDRRFADLSRVSPVDEAAFARLVIAGAPQGLAHGGSTAVGYGHYLSVMRRQRPAADAPQPAFDAWAAQVLQGYSQFQLLCALRSGPFGVDQLNPRIAGLLRGEGLLEAETAGWYPGRPVLVTRNDYGLGLMNGDVGVTLAVPAGLATAGTSPASAAGVVAAADAADAAGEAVTTPSGSPRPSGSGDRPARWVLRVAFPAGDGQGGIRWVLPSRLRAVETVFAMTVHKSQGSEFTHAALMLPLGMSPVLTRELVYTGITRARQWFTLVATDAVLQAATARRVDRMGGLSMNG